MSESIYELAEPLLPLPLGEIQGLANYHPCTIEVNETGSLLHDVDGEQMVAMLGVKDFSSVIEMLRPRVDRFRMWWQKRSLLAVLGWETECGVVIPLAFDHNGNPGVAHVCVPHFSFVFLVLVSVVPKAFPLFGVHGDVRRRIFLPGVPNVPEPPSGTHSEFFKYCTLLKRGKHNTT